MIKTNYIFFIFVALAQMAFAYKALTDESLLHCDQRTSFYIATFDTEPHLEERPGPAIYHHPYSTPLRVGYSSAFVLFVFTPILYTYMTFIKQRIVKFKSIAILWVAFLLHTIGSLFLAGERFAFTNFEGMVMVTFSLGTFFLARIILRTIKRLSKKELA